MGAFGCVSDQSSPSTRSQSEITQPRRIHPRQRQWAHGPLYERPTTAEIDSYKNLVRTATAREQWYPPLVDATTLNTLRSGQTVIRMERAPTGTWHPEEVRVAAQEFGNRFPFLMGQIGSLGWSEHLQALVVNPAFVARELDPEVASITTFHEATHLVFERYILTHCSFTSQEWMALIDTCADVAYERAFAQEVVAYINEERWAHRIDENAYAHMYVRTRDARRHQPTHFAEQIEEHTRGLRPGRHCGPPVIVRGPREGQYCLPALVAGDDLVLMVVNARH